MSSQAVARRYAVALAEVVLARGEAQEVREELAAWDELVRSNAELLEVFRHPAITHEQKRSVLEELIRRARPRPTTANFLKVLLQNGRLAELGPLPPLRKLTGELAPRELRMQVDRAIAALDAQRARGRTPRMRALF